MLKMILRAFLLGIELGRKRGEITGRAAGFDEGFQEAKKRYAALVAPENHLRFDAWALLITFSAGLLGMASVMLLR